MLYLNMNLEFVVYKNKKLKKLKKIKKIKEAELCGYR
jgi:hypothetical protein